MTHAWPEGTPVDHAMHADPSLRPPPRALAGEGDARLVRHPRAFGLHLVPGHAGVSRSVPHIGNVEFVRWLDRAAELHADSLGWTRQAMVESGRMWFVARHELDYRAEAFPGQRLLVFTWVRTMGRSTSWRDTAVLRADDGAPVCTASTCWALVDLSTRKPVRIPADMAASFDPLEGVRCTSPS